MLTPFCISQKHSEEQTESNPIGNLRSFKLVSLSNPWTKATCSPTVLKTPTPSQSQQDTQWHQSTPLGGCCSIPCHVALDCYPD